MSATFRVRSDGANTAYWFEKTGSTNFLTFKKGSSNASDSDLQSMLRISVTVDGATNVYALNSEGTYQTVSSVTATSTTQKTGRAITAYTYCEEQFSSNGFSNTSANASLSNHDSSGNLNGNTLFTVSKYDSSTPSTIKTVTIKLWLECKSETLANNVSSVDVASVNLNLVSSWAKTRRIYVKDETIKQAGYNQDNWLRKFDGEIFWGIADDWTVGHSLTSTGVANTYYIDLPAIYNDTPCGLFRCYKKYNQGNDPKNFTRLDGTTQSVTFWNVWETTFPNTFHSETYTVCTTEFATWEDNPNHIFFLNSCAFGNPRAYMWDINFGSGRDDKVVQNASWPGVNLTKLLDNHGGKDFYAFYYNADYSNIIFSNGLARRRKLGASKPRY